jgi:PAS domain S-box-containing protein
MPSADPILEVIQDAVRLLDDGVVVTTGDLDQPGPRILHVNDAFCRITGYRADELIGQTPRMLQGSRTNRAVLSAMRAALDAHRQFAGELVNYRKDGRDYTVQIQIAPIGDADGRPRYWLSHHRDVSERRRTEAELRDREYRFRSLLNNMRDIIVCHGASGGGPHGYEAGAMLLGRDVQRMAGTRQGEKADIDLWYRSIHPDDRDAYLAAERRRKESSQAYTIEYRIIHPVTRQVRWMQERGWTVQQLDGDARFYDSYIIDVTERKRAEQLLAGQNRVLEMIARGRPLADTLDSLARLIESQSDGMLCSILLLDEEGRHLRQGAAPSLPEAYNRAIDGLSIGPRAGSCGTAAHRREPVIVTDTYDDPLWSEYRDLAMAYELRSCWSTPIFSEEGRVLGTFAMYYRNVRSPSPAEQKLIGIATHAAGIAIERKRAEAAQSESEERFRNLADSVPALIWMSDAGGQCIFVNGPWLAYTGRTMLQEVGRGFVEGIHPDDRARVLTDELQAIDQRAVLATEYRLRRHGGDYRSFLVTAAPRFTDGGDGEYIGHLGILIDVTERRLLEEKVREMQRLEAIGRLTEGVARDFNNLLTVILSNAESLLALARDGSRQATLLHLIQSAAERGAGLTQRLLAFARRQPLEPQPTDLNRLLVRLEDAMRRAVGERVALDCVQRPDLWLALVDPAPLEAALLNLAINARDAMPDGGTLTIDTANRRIDEASEDLAAGHYVALAVTDTGVGMSADVRRRAIEPFFTTKPAGHGSGLGLSMVYGFAKQSRGTVVIDSTIGCGTTVTLYLPRADTAAPARRPDGPAQRPTATHKAVPAG